MNNRMKHRRQVMLKGRGTRHGKRSGICSGRGPGRTSQSRGVRFGGPPSLKLTRDPALAQMIEQALNEKGATHGTKATKARG
jgi:hypothetical protein